MNDIVSAGLWVVYFFSLFFAIFWLLVLMDTDTQKKRKTMKSWPPVSIVFPAYNEGDNLCNVVESALKLDYPSNLLEFIIVNDGSQDNTESVAKKLVKKHKGYDIKYLFQKNQGKGAALNNALKIARGDYFVCLDADSFVEPSALKELLPYFEDNVAAVLPALKVERPKNMLQKIQRHEYIVNLFFKELMSRLDSVHVTPGPFSVYRKKILLEVGGFDENNLTEDMEIALRLQSRNYRIIQALDTSVYTMVPTNLMEFYRQRNRWYKGSVFNAIKYRGLMFNKSYGDFGILQMPTIILAGIFALVIILATVYDYANMSFSFFKNLWLVGFDIMPFLVNVTYDINLLDLNYATLLISIFMLCITSYVIVRSHGAVDERVKTFGYGSLVLFLFVYFFVIAIMWVGIVFELILGKVQKW